MYYIYSISTTYYFNYLSLFDIFLIIYFVIWYLDLISGSVPTYPIVNNFFYEFPCALCWGLIYYSHERNASQLERRILNLPLSNWLWWRGGSLSVQRSLVSLRLEH